MKDFVTAAKAELSEEEDFGFDIEVRLDKGTDKERELLAHKPSDGQLMVFMAMAGDDLKANTQVIARSIDFLYSLLDDVDKQYIYRRLMDVKDAFGADEVAAILGYILEEWSGKAGGSRTALQRSRQTNGRSSTTSRRKTA